MLGDPGVGKTSLILRYVENAFSEKYLHTIGTKISKKVVAYGDIGTTVNLLIWDIVGQRSMGVLRSYFRGASAALLVCDITREETLHSLLEWGRSLKEVAGNVPFIIIANKSDLEDRGRVTDANLAYISRQLGAAPYIFTSAKTGSDVDTAFYALGRLALGAGSPGGVTDNRTLFLYCSVMRNLGYIWSGSSPAGAGVPARERHAEILALVKAGQLEAAAALSDEVLHPREPEAAPAPAPPPEHTEERAASPEEVRVRAVITEAEELVNDARNSEVDIRRVERLLSLARYFYERKEFDNAEKYARKTLVELKRALG